MPPLPSLLSRCKEASMNKLYNLPNCGLMLWTDAVDKIASVIDSPLFSPLFSLRLLVSCNYCLTYSFTRFCLLAFLSFSRFIVTLCVCMYACMHVCMYACVCVCVYACMCACVYVRREKASSQRTFWMTTLRMMAC
jgi:FtsH-binding integral membrane protein